MFKMLRDLKSFLIELKQQDFAFLMACGYLVFSFMRPQAIYPELDILPWTQLCILLGLFHQVVNNQFKLKFGHFLIFAFAIICTISANSSSYPQVSSDKLSVIYIWLIEVVFFTNCIKNKRQAKLILALFVLILFKMSFFGARTWMNRGFGFTSWGLAGPPGFFANSGEYSLLMAIYLVISICFLYQVFRVKKYFYLIPVTALLTVLGASSRGGQLALVVGLVYLMMALGKMSIKHLIITTIVCVSVYSLMPQEQLERFQSMGDDNTSKSRLEYWDAGLEMMDNNKLIGIGYYAFPYYYRDYYQVHDGEDSFLAQRMEVAHNSFIEVGSTLGYTGLAMYLLIIYYAFTLNRKTFNLTKNSAHEHQWIAKTSIGLNAAIVVYLTGSMFMSVAFYPYLYFLLMFSIMLRDVSLVESHKGFKALPTTG